MSRHAQLSNIDPLAHVLGTCALILVFGPFLQFPQPHHVTVSHPSPCDEPPERSRAVRKNTGTKQKCSRETQSSACAPGLCTTSYLSPSPSSLCCPRQHSHHPSNLTSSYPVPALNFLPPSIPFYEQDEYPYVVHSFAPLVQTTLILSVPPYSSTPFIFQLFYAPLRS